MGPNIIILHVCIYCTLCQKPLIYRRNVVVQQECVPYPRSLCDYTHLSVRSCRGYGGIILTPPMYPTTAASCYRHLIKRLRFPGLRCVGLSASNSLKGDWRWVIPSCDFGLGRGGTEGDCCRESDHRRQSGTAISPLRAVSLQNRSKWLLLLSIAVHESTQIHSFPASSGSSESIDAEYN